MTQQKVGGIILDGQQNLLLVLGKYSQKWGVPKGSLEESDENLLQGALREIKEETGLRLMPVSTNTLDWWTVNKARLYLLEVEEVRPRLKPHDRSEIENAIWLDLKDNHQVEQVKANSNKMLLAILKKLYQSI